MKETIEQSQAMKRNARKALRMNNGGWKDYVTLRGFAIGMGILHPDYFTRGE